MSQYRLDKKWMVDLGAMHLPLGFAAVVVTVSHTY